MIEQTDNILDLPVGNLKGVGTKRAELLRSMGIITIRDVLYHAPYKYIDLSSLDHIANLCHGQDAVVRARVISEPQIRRMKNRFSVTAFYIDDGTSTAQCIYYNQPYIVQNIKKEMERIFIGKADARHGILQIVNPTIEKINADRNIAAYYSLKKGISNSVFTGLARQAMDLARGSIRDELPHAVRTEYELPEINDCIGQIHFPDSMDEAKRCRDRLSLEELLLFMAALEAVKNQRAGQDGIIIKDAGMHLQQFLTEQIPAACPGQAQTGEDDPVRTICFEGSNSVLNLRGVKRHIRRAYFRNDHCQAHL